MTGINSIAAAMRLFCALVLLSLGFGHQPLQAGLPNAQLDSSTVQARAERYRLPDGSFASLCLQGEAGRAESHGHAGGGLLPCDICVLAASMLLPAPAADSDRAVSGPWLKNAFSRRSVTTQGHGLIEERSRAPPLVV